MTLTIVLVLAAAAALALILYTVAVRRGEIVSIARGAAQIQPVDIQAFRNLIDPAEDDYLRRHLAPKALRRVRRARLRAMAAYVSQAGRNAAVLARIGEGALDSNDAASREAAARLVNDALLLRRNAALTLLKIYVVLAWPNSSRGAVPVVEGYERLSGSAMLLGRLQSRGTAVRIAAP
jgi:hypothetical protein